MYMKKPNSTSLFTFLEDCLGRLQNLDTKHQQKIEEIGRASTLCSKQIETAMQLCPGVSLERMSVAYVLTDRVTSERCTHALANPSFCRHCSSGLGLGVIQHIYAHLSNENLFVLNSHLQHLSMR